MIFATVMVSRALDGANETRLEVVGQLAERFDAGVIGITAAQFSPPLYVTASEQAETLLDQGWGRNPERVSPNGDANPCRGGGMAQRRGFSDTHHRSGSARCRRHRYRAGWREGSCRSVQAGQTQRSCHTGRL